MYKNKRHKLELLRAQLELERSSFLSHWRELGEYILPRRPRFEVTDVNRGDKRNQKIYDSTATLSARTLRSGMMAGVTSPARPWFRLTTPDPELGEMGAIKNWLSTCQQRMSTSFLRSNLYNMLPVTYGDLGVFGTAPIFVEEDFKDVIRCTSFPIGSYMIAKDFRGVVNTFCREFRMTVRQLVEQFGRKVKGEYDWSNFSKTVKGLYDNAQYEQWVDVVHIVYPNDDYMPERVEAKYKKYSSCYYERGSYGVSGSQNIDTQHIGGLDTNVFLRESGYDYFPVLCPRWEVTGEDVYGTDCPGMTALPDIKQLQTGEKRLAQAIEKMVNPPMTAPTSLKNSRVSILPGDVTYADERTGMAGLRPTHEVNLSINEMEGKQAQVRNRVQRAFYEDLFLMLANDTRSGITAREIEERHEEKLLALGPVLEQLNQDLLDPLIDIAFDIHMRQGQIPPPPEELQGQNLKVEYISIMAQAQKLVGISGVERFTNYVGGLAGINPDVLDKVDMDQAVDVYGDMTSVPPSMIRTDDKVAQIRAQKQQAMQAQQQMNAMQQGAMIAKDLSQADTSGENALTALAEQARAGQLTPGG